MFWETFQSTNQHAIDQSLKRRRQKHWSSEDVQNISSPGSKQLESISSIASLARDLSFFLVQVSPSQISHIFFTSGSGALKLPKKWFRGVDHVLKLPFCHFYILDI